MYTNTIDGGFAINRFEVLADLQAPVSTLLNVCFPGECRQNPDFCEYLRPRFHGRERATEGNEVECHSRTPRSR